MSRSFKQRPSPALVVALIALFAALGGGAYAATSFIGSDGQIHGCVGKKGQLTLLKPGKKCAKGKSAIAWNQLGRRGLRGKPGLSTSPAGGDLAGNYPNPTLKPAEAVRAVAPVSGAGNCNVSVPPSGEFCAFGANGWHWQNNGGGYAPAGFFRDRSGIVHLQGSVEETGPGNTPIFVLPPGYRPSSTRAFPVRDDSESPPINSVEILVDGKVNKLTPSSTQLLSLDGIDFRP